jgi:hypothetical protein
MARTEIYKSKGKALAMLIAPAIMSFALVMFYQHDPDFFNNWVAWLWLIVIGFVSWMAVNNLRQKTPALVLDEHGICYGPTCHWNQIQQILLVNRMYGPRKVYSLVLQLPPPHKEVRIEVTELVGRPPEIFELVNEYWTENRHRTPPEKPAAVAAASPPATKPATQKFELVCPHCGSPVEEDDCECSRCYARLV